MPCCISFQIASSMNCIPWLFPPTIDVLKLLRGAFANDRGDGAVDDEDFVHREPPAAVGLFQKQLRDDAAQRRREHRAHLRLLIGGKDVDHAIDGFAGVVRVQGAEDEQAGLGGGEGE